MGRCVLDLSPRLKLRSTRSRPASTPHGARFQGGHPDCVPTVYDHVETRLYEAALRGLLPLIMGADDKVGSVPGAQVVAIGYLPDRIIAVAFFAFRRDQSGELTADIVLSL